MHTSACFQHFAGLRGGTCQTMRMQRRWCVPHAHQRAGGTRRGRGARPTRSSGARSFSLLAAAARGGIAAGCNTGVGRSLARARLLSGAGRARPLPSSLSLSLLGAGGRSCPRAHRSASAARCGATRSLRLGRANGGGDADTQPQVVKAGKKVGGFGHRARGNCRHDMCVCRIALSATVAHVHRLGRVAVFNCARRCSAGLTDSRDRAHAATPPCTQAPLYTPSDTRVRASRARLRCAPPARRRRPPLPRRGQPTGRPPARP